MSKIMKIPLKKTKEKRFNDKLYEILKYQELNRAVGSIYFLQYEFDIQRKTWSRTRNKYRKVVIMKTLVDVIVEDAMDLHLLNATNVATFKSIPCSHILACDRWHTNSL